MLLLSGRVSVVVTGAVVGTNIDVEAPTPLLLGVPSLLREPPDLASSSSPILSACDGLIGSRIIPLCLLKLFSS